MSRCVQRSRATSETEITIGLDLDGSGRTDIATGIGFFDHMLTAFGRHAMLDLTISAEGDLHIDAHHTVEDTGIVIGQALREALGDKSGIRRYGHAIVPMDEALVEAAIDISGRAFLVWQVAFERPMLGDMDTQLAEEFFRALAGNAGIALHVTQKSGHNAHHVAEAAFKAVARALRVATEPDPRAAGVVPSTKGSL